MCFTNTGTKIPSSYLILSKMEASSVFHDQKDGHYLITWLKITRYSTKRMRNPTRLKRVCPLNPILGPVINKMNQKIAINKALATVKGHATNCMSEYYSLLSISFGI